MSTDGAHRSPLAVLTEADSSDSTESESISVPDISEVVARPLESDTAETWTIIPLEVRLSEDRWDRWEVRLPDRWGRWEEVVRKGLRRAFPADAIRDFEDVIMRNGRRTFTVCPICGDPRCSISRIAATISRIAATILDGGGW